MTEKEYQKIYKEAIDTRKNYPYLRKGQCVYNAFAKHLSNEEWFNSITATDIDPFYNDDKIDSFLNTIKKHVVL